MFGGSISGFDSNYYMNKKLKRSKVHDKRADYCDNLSCFLLVKPHPCPPVQSRRLPGELQILAFTDRWTPGAISTALLYLARARPTAPLPRW